MLWLCKSDRVLTLLTINKCCAWMKKYLDTNAAGTYPDKVNLDILTNPLLVGRTWKAFVESEKVNDYKSELAGLSTKLNGATVVHIARTTEVVFDGGMSFLRNSFCELDYENWQLKRNDSFPNPS